MESTTHQKTNFFSLKISITIFSDRPCYSLFSAMYAQLIKDDCRFFHSSLVFHLKIFYFHFIIESATNTSIITLRVKDFQSKRARSNFI